jgi:hypothetical protein
VADGWCWFVLREEYCWLVAGGWFVLREKHCWLVADKPSEQAVKRQIQSLSFGTNFWARILKFPAGIQANVGVNELFRRANLYWKYTIHLSH